MGESIALCLTVGLPLARDNSAYSIHDRRYGHFERTLGGHRPSTLIVAAPYCVFVVTSLGSDSAAGARFVEFMASRGSINWSGGIYLCGR